MTSDFDFELLKRAFRGNFSESSEISSAHFFEKWPETPKSESLIKIWCDIRIQHEIWRLSKKTWVKIRPKIVVLRRFSEKNAKFREKMRNFAEKYEKGAEFQKNIFFSELAQNFT